MKHIFFERFGPPSLVAQCVEIPDPSPPSAWEIVVYVDAFAINPADLAMLQGRYGILNKPPSTIGMEGTGVVAQVGKSVQGFEIGDRVILLANNNWATTRKLAASTTVKVDPSIDPLQLAMLKVSGLTAYKLLHDMVQLKPGDYVIQNGPLSAVGQYVIQMARILGLKSINLVRRPEQFIAVKELGGDLAILDDENAPATIRHDVGNAPLRLGLDCVAGDATQRLATCLSEGGRIINYGILSGESCHLSPEQTIFRDIQLHGFWLSKTLNKLGVNERTEQLTLLANWVRDHGLHGPIDSVFAIDQIGDAIRRSEQSGRTGKVLVCPQRGSSPQT